MTVLAVQQLPGATAEIAAMISREADVHDNPPDGLIAHAVAQTPDGLIVVDLWQNAEHLETFQRDRLGPASSTVFAHLGIDGPPPPPITVHPVVEILLGQSDQA